MGENVTTSTSYHTQTVMQNETETTYKPQGKVQMVPVEQVHEVPTTVTVPVKRQIKVETIVKEPTFTTRGCDLVVESCFATPAVEGVPSWKAPVLSYEKSYTTLCADEAAAKKAEEKKHKALKEAQVKCSEKSQKGEKTAKEVSKKGAEREEKLFKSEKDSKESAAKAISAANTREKIVYVPSAAPKIVPEPKAAPIPKAPKAVPVPAPVAKPETKYVCDAKTCQCVKSTNDQGDDFNYCTEMCSTSPGCVPVPPPPAITPPPALPRIFTPAPAPERVQYVRYTPAPVPVAPVVVPSEGPIKAELKQKTAESASKEKTSKHTTTQENFYKRQPVRQVYAPRPQEPALQSLEKGTKKVQIMKERFGKAKLQGVEAIKEAWSKHGTVAKANNHCKETHEICGKIHTASAARQVTAAKVAATHTAELEASCAKTVAFAKEEARELTFHICAAAAEKLEGLCHSLSEDFEFGAALNDTKTLA